MTKILNCFDENAIKNVEGTEIDVIQVTDQLKENKVPGPDGMQTL